MDKTTIAVDLFDRRASEYQDKYMDLSLYHDSLIKFCQAVEKENAAVLDIACGPGNITKYLLERRPDFRVLGIDLAPGMIELAKMHNPAAEFQIMDCRVISKISKKYDAVVCGFCLPYLTKEASIKLISDVSGLLNTDGLFYISTMEDDYSKSGLQQSSSGEDEMFIHYHQADYLTNALKERNFKLINVDRKKDQEQELTTTNDLIIIAKKLS